MYRIPAAPPRRAWGSHPSPRSATHPTTHTSETSLWRTHTHTYTHTHIYIYVYNYLRRLHGGHGVVERNEVLGQPPILVLVGRVQDLFFRRRCGWKRERCVGDIVFTEDMGSCRRKSEVCGRLRGTNRPMERKEGGGVGRVFLRMYVYIYEKANAGRQRTR